MGEIRIPGCEVVIGDLLVLHEGDRIAADALLLQGRLSVDESLLTGEAVPVSKIPNLQIAAMQTPGSDDIPSLFASTVVTQGVGFALVQAIGTDTAVGHISQSLGTTHEIPSALQHASGSLIRTVSMIAVGLALGLVLVNWIVNERSFLESLLSGIALAMATLPEEIPVILTVFWLWVPGVLQKSRY
jgi:Ca2+-transporting ATPase